MDSHVSKELLFKPRLPEADVEIPGVGTVRVRGLTRAESLLIQQAKSKGVDAIERKLLHLGLVDPPMTEAEVGRWQAAATSGEMDAVSEKVAELSGMADGSAKAAYADFRDESGA